MTIFLEVIWKANLRGPSCGKLDMFDGPFGNDLCAWEMTTLAVSSQREAIFENGTGQTASFEGLFLLRRYFTTNHAARCCAVRWRNEVLNCWSVHLKFLLAIHSSCDQIPKIKFCDTQRSALTASYRKLRRLQTWKQGRLSASKPRALANRFCIVWIERSILWEY